MAIIDKDKEKEKKKKMRKAAVKGTLSSIKSTLFPDKKTRSLNKAVRQEKREIKREFQFGGAAAFAALEAKKKAKGKLSSSAVKVIKNTKNK